MTSVRPAGKIIIVAAALFVAAGAVQIEAQPAHHSQKASLDTLLIKQTIGEPGVWIADEGVYKVNVPRTDVKIKVDGTVLPPFMGVTTWVGFQQAGSSTMAMGDLVLFQDEVNPVMSVLLDGGMAVTGLHNHFFYSEPAVFFMHVSGDGQLGELTKTVRAVLDKVKAIRAEHPTPSSSSDSASGIGESSLSAAPIEQILGLKANTKDGMLKFVVGRTVTMSSGHEVGKEMGINSWAGLMGTDAHAIIDGDFATTEGELQPVLKSLRHSGINIVAIHNHMEGETPRLIFLHYWGTGSATELALGFKGALDAQAATHRKSGRD